MLTTWVSRSIRGVLTRSPWDTWIVIKRAAAQFDRVIVCVMINSHKQGLFRPEERVELIKRVVGRLDNVEVDASGELLAEYAKKKRSILCREGPAGHVRFLRRSSKWPPLTES